MQPDCIAAVHCCHWSWSAFFTAQAFTCPSLIVTQPLQLCVQTVPLPMDVLHASHKSRCLLTGKGLSLGKNVAVCRQSLGYAMHNRPITTDINVLHMTRACQGQRVSCMQSFFIDLKSLSNVSGLNSGIYSALTASFVLAGLIYIGLPSQTLTAIFGSAAEKGLEDIFLWQLIGTAVSMAVAPIGFTQQVRWLSKCACMHLQHASTAVTCKQCNASAMIQSVLQLKCISARLIRCELIGEGAM